jgi:serine/threonine-protein kinase
MRTHLGHYEIVAELGRGGMGVVYKGFEAALNRYVAIKVLADSLAHDEAIRERFLREARSMAALNDPHIIQIYFIGEDEGQTYFVMEFVEGESLGSMLKRDHRLTVEQAAKIIQQTALGLATAHDRGVVHRDVKPGNLMITSRGSVKIADFGIALSNQDLSKKLTTTGEFVGTPGYLSPEVCLGRPVDQRSDIFSLGIVLFEMLTGRMPFNDESPLGLMLEVVKAEIPDVRQINAEADPQIAQILSRMIAKEPADRYPSCHELVADLNTHPLVAKGGPITVQTKISPAAATLIGNKTPISGQTSLPKTPPTLRMASAVADTRITPSGLPAPPPAATAHRSVLERSANAEAKPRSSALQGAVVTLLLLGLAGGAFAYRDRIPGLSGLVGASSNPPAPAAGSGTGANAAPSASDSIRASITQSTEVPPPPPPPAKADAVTASQPADAAAATNAAANAQAQATPSAATAPVPDRQDAAVATTAPGTGAGNPPDTGAAQPAPAAVVPAAAPPQVARATPSDKPAAAPKPRIPTIAVVAGGDDVIASPAVHALIQRLQGRGFRVIEGGHAQGDRPSLRGLSGRADAVVFIQARPVGSQQLNYYGQSSTLYTVQLGLTAYRVGDGSVLWTGGTQQVNFTNLNAAEKAREAIEPMLGDVDGRLDEFRAGGRRG